MPVPTARSFVHRFEWLVESGYVTQEDAQFALRSPEFQIVEMNLSLCAILARSRKQSVGAYIELVSELVVQVFAARYVIDITMNRVKLWYL